MSERPAAHENVLARRTYRLEHPEDPAQVLYCYCDKRASANGKEKGGKGTWQNLYGASHAAGPVLMAVDRDDVRALAKIFRQATRRTKQS